MTTYVASYGILQRVVGPIIRNHDKWLSDLEQTDVNGIADYLSRVVPAKQGRTSKQISHLVTIAQSYRSLWTPDLHCVAYYRMRTFTTL